MDSRSGGLRAVARPFQNDQKLHSAASGLPIRLVFLVAMALTLCSWFPSVGVSVWMVLLGVLLASACLSILRLTGKGTPLCIGMLLGLLIACGCFYPRVLAGIGVLANDLLEQLTYVSGRIYLKFSVAEEASVLWGVIPILGIGILLLHLSEQTGKLLFFLPCLLLVYLASLTGLYPIDAGVLLLFIGGILLLMRTACGETGSRGYWGTPAWLAVVCVCGALSVGLGTIAGSLWGSTDHLKQTAHRLFYDEETNSMPEGNLKNLGKWDKSDTPALLLTMTQPQKLYLRGQVYENYTAAAWTPLETEEKAAYGDLFYWLHQSGFYGQSQIGTAMGFTTQAPSETLTVKNLSACGAHGYYPYGLRDSTSLDEAWIGDAVFPVSASYSYLPGSVPEWYTVQANLAQAQERSNISRYLTCEEAFEAYVTAVDLQLTDESWSVLNRQLQEDGTPKTLSQIRELIRDYLDEALVYDESVVTANGTGDFLQYTLERTGSGYSVHYATAATLMLRYFGVPARYVEGYFLSGEEAASYEPGQPIVLTEEHAHAWAEYYLPGVGFVPFEVTPGYMDDEELKLGGGSLRNEQTYTGNNLKYAQVERPERIEEPPQTRISFSLKPVHLICLLALLMLPGVAVILRKRRKLRNTLRSIDMAPCREAIAMRYGYAVRLLRTCPSADVQGGQQAWELNREALFSNHEMTIAQKAEMDGYAHGVLLACKKKWTLWEKLRYRYWNCLY